MHLIIHIDGGARGNPGPAGAGVTIQDEAGNLVHEAGYFLGRQTNNAAEYTALLRGLQRAAACGPERVTIYSDSELLVKQITGEYRVKSPKLAQLFKQAQMLLVQLGRWSIRHVRREQNCRADELANLAMDQKRDVIVMDVDDDAVAATPVAAASEVDDQPDPASAPTTTAGEREQAPPQVSDGPRRAHVTVSRAPNREGCPAGGCDWESLTIDTVLPKGLCIYAAHALAPTIIAVLNTAPEEFNAIPTLTVRCMRPECGATFHVSPARSSNGKTCEDQST